MYSLIRTGVKKAMRSLRSSLGHCPDAENTTIITVRTPQRTAVSTGLSFRDDGGGESSHPADTSVPHGGSEKKIKELGLSFQ